MALCLFKMYIFDRIVKNNTDILKPTFSTLAFFQEQIALQDRIKNLKKYPEPDYDVIEKINDEKIDFISQRQGIISRNSVETMMGPCVIMIILNKDSGEQFMAHVDDGTILLPPNKIASWRNQEAVIVFGEQGHKGTIGEILKFLDVLGINEIFKYEPNGDYLEDYFYSVSSSPAKIKNGAFKLLLEPFIKRTPNSRMLFIPSVNARTPLFITGDEPKYLY